MPCAVAPPRDILFAPLREMKAAAGDNNL